MTSGSAGEHRGNPVKNGEVGSHMKFTREEQLEAWVHADQAVAWLRPDLQQLIRSMNKGLKSSGDPIERVASCRVMALLTVAFRTGGLGNGQENTLLRRTAAYRSKSKFAASLNLEKTN